MDRRLDGWIYVKIDGLLSIILIILNNDNNDNNNDIFVYCSKLKTTE